MNSQSNSISPDSGNNTFDMNSDDRVPDDENIEDNLDNFISDLQVNKQISDISKLTSDPNGANRVIAKYIGIQIRHQYECGRIKVNGPKGTSVK